MKFLTLFILIIAIYLINNHFSISSRKANRSITSLSMTLHSCNGSIYEFVQGRANHIDILRDLMDAYKVHDKAKFKEHLKKMAREYSPDSLKRLMFGLQNPHATLEILSALIDLPIPDNVKLPQVHRFGSYPFNPNRSITVDETYLLPQIGLPQWENFNEINVMRENMFPSHFSYLSHIDSLPELREGEAELSRKRQAYFKLQARKTNQFVLKIYREIIGKNRTVFTDDFIKMLEQENANLYPEHLFFYMYNHYGSANIDAAVSIYDPGVYRDIVMPIPIEKKYPTLKLKGRESDSRHIIEIRRMAKSDSASINFFTIMVRNLAEHIKYAELAEATIYAHTDAVGAKLYSKLGFNIEYSPESLNKDEYILSITGADFIEKVESLLKFKSSKNPFKVLKENRGESYPPYRIDGNFVSIDSLKRNIINHSPTYQDRDPFESVSPSSNVFTDYRHYDSVYDDLVNAAFSVQAIE